MSRIKKIMSAGILLASGSLIFSPSATPPTNTSSQQSHKQTLPALKRTPMKIYHRFEDIPEIPDKDAHLYNKNEYSYIINADIYQKTGKIELKRVLSAEVTQAHALSLIYRSECGDYIPKEDEDQLARYVVEMKLINPSGKFLGPSQMDDNAIKSYIMFLAINPNTREYVIPLLQYTSGKDTPSTLPEALNELEKLYYNENGSLRSMKEREKIISQKLYKNIKLKNNVWNNLASPALKSFIAREEYKRKRTLSNTAKNYLCLTELFPSTQLMQQSLEEFNLTSYVLGRSGKPNQIMLALALSMNLKDENGNLNATRIPSYAIAAAISHVNWKGNGSAALRQTKNLRHDFEQSWEKGLNTLFHTAKQWVTGKSRTKGVRELSQLNIITPALIKQYQQLELAGADRLAENYKKLVEEKESQISQPCLTQLILQTPKHR